MDVEKYITDEAVRLVQNAAAGRADFPGRDGLRAALPGILAQHRADVLRKVRDSFDPQGVTWTALNALYLEADEVVAQ